MIPFTVSLRWLSELTSASSLPEFTPPPRFGKTHFSDYRPQHPSQELALKNTQSVYRRKNAATLVLAKETIG